MAAVPGTTDIARSVCVAPPVAVCPQSTIVTDGRGTDRRQRSVDTDSLACQPRVGKNHRHTSLAMRLQRCSVIGQHEIDSYPDGLKAVVRLYVQLFLAKKA